MRVLGFKQLLVLLEDDLAAVVDGRDAQFGALLGRELLPGHDVGVMLEVRDDDLVVLVDVASTPGLGNEVDALGGPAHEDDALGRRRIDERAHLRPRALVGVGRARGERVRGAMDVGIFALVEEREAVDHALRLLRRRGVVEPHERAPVDALVEDGEVAPDDVRVERAHAGDGGCRRAKRRHVLVGECRQIEDGGLVRERCRARLRGSAAVEERETLRWAGVGRSRNGAQQASRRRAALGRKARHKRHHAAKRRWERREIGRAREAARSGGCCPSWSCARLRSGCGRHGRRPLLA